MNIKERSTIISGPDGPIIKVTATTGEGFVRFSIYKMIYRDINTWLDVTPHIDKGSKHSWWDDGLKEHFTSEQIEDIGKAQTMLVKSIYREDEIHPGGLAAFTTHDLLQELTNRNEE